MATDLENNILKLIESKANGATNEDIIKGTPSATREDCLTTLNTLLSQGSITLFEKNQKLIYRIKDPTKRHAPGGSTNEESIVFRIIEEGGNRGVWVRDIRTKSNLSDNQLKKILQTLETKNHIKAVKSVNASKRKVYMLFDLEPDQSITGGAWYQDQVFDSEYVDAHIKICLQFLRLKKDKAEKKCASPLEARHASFATVKEVQEYLEKTGVSKVKLYENDIEKILRVVIYDGNAERTLLPNNEYAYYAINKPFQAFGLVQSTCGLCPLINNCVTDNEISPTNCEYMSDWLQ